MTVNSLSKEILLHDPSYAHLGISVGFCMYTYVYVDLCLCVHACMHVIRICIYIVFKPGAVTDAYCTLVLIIS
jgi:hypothetical protein